ncbi:hypothetical protein RKD41_006539 [Streptomyces tendae]
MALHETSRPESAGASRSLTAPALDPGDRDRLLAGAHHDPHALLGAHPVPGGIAVRALRPFARAVSVLVDGERTALVSEGGGLFSALLPLPRIPAYTLLVSYQEDGGDEHETHDPYRFLPALGELDLHLIREGRHEELWKALGAEPMEHQGVAGTRFTVWARRTLRVCGSPGTSATGTGRRSRCGPSARPGCGSCSCPASVRAPGTSSRSPPGTATAF